MLSNNEISGLYETIEPSDSSDSITNQSLLPTHALPGKPFFCKTLNPAPVISDGDLPHCSIIWKIIAVVVDFPDVPPTAIVRTLFEISANNCERFIIGIPNCTAFWYSTFFSSIAVETTTTSTSSVMPCPS